METARHSARADVEQEEGPSGTEGLDCETFQEAGDIMDFSVHAIAEQLTRLDSVSERECSEKGFVTVALSPRSCFYLTSIRSGC